jgi:hypothetical protein
MTTLFDATEVHPGTIRYGESVSAGVSGDIVVIPVPVAAAPPGALVNVHEPDDGKPFKTTLPVATVQLGCVNVPNAGESGVTGWGEMIALFDAGEVHPEAWVTVKV